MKNAYNTAKWKMVLDAFKNMRMDNYLHNIVEVYLDNRIILYETENVGKLFRCTIE